MVWDLKKNEMKKPGVRMAGNHPELVRLPQLLFFLLEMDLEIEWIVIEYEWNWFDREMGYIWAVNWIIYTASLVVNTPSTIIAL